MNYSPRHFRIILQLVLAFLILPLFLISYPPLSDLPNHLARLYILSTGDADPVLSRMWHSNWHLFPNLAIDILGVALLHLASIEFVARFTLILIIVLILSGCIQLHRAIFGRLSYWPLISGLFIYNAIFLMGFLNFLLGVGIALHAAAYWANGASGSPKKRIILSLFFAALLFFSHIFSLAFYLLFIGSWQLGLLLEAKLDFAALKQQLLPPLPAGILGLLLAAMAPHYTGRHIVLWSALRQKAEYALSPFMNYFPLFDLASALLVIGLLAMLALSRKLEIRLGVKLFMAIAALLFFVCPMAYDNGGFLNARIPMLIWLMVAAGVSADTLAPPLQKFLGVVVAALFLLRLGALAGVWIEARHDLEQFHALGHYLPPGARVLDTTVTPDDYSDKKAFYSSQPRAREVQGYASMNLHFTGYWVMDRKIFWPLLFASSNQQPVMAIPPYDALALSVGTPPDYRLLAQEPLSYDALESNPYLAHWQRNFDYVVVLSAGQARHLDVLSHLPLTLLAKTDVAALYKINK